MRRVPGTLTLTTTDAPPRPHYGVGCSGAPFQERLGGSRAARPEGEVVTNPGGDVTTERGDVLVLLGTNDQLDRVRRVLDSG